MKTRTTICFGVFFIGFIHLSHAQYFDATHRQSHEETELLKAHNIREKITYIQQGDNTAPYGVNYYDTGGRVIFIANPMHHEHFRYDDKGRMTYWLDSANDGRRFEKHEYYFGYDSKGALNLYKTEGAESRFFNSDNNVQEDILHKGLVTEVRKYSYNNDGKLILELFKEPGNDSTAKILHLHKVLYNKYGDVASEIVYNALEDCKGDSVVTINTYDSKGRIVHRQKSIKTLKCGATPLVTDRKTVSESVSFIYNAAGLPVTESMVCGDPSLNYRKEFAYNESGILIKESSYDGKGKPTTSMQYSYIYFPVKRK